MPTARRRARYACHVLWVLVALALDGCGQLSFQRNFDTVKRSLSLSTSRDETHRPERQVTVELDQPPISNSDWQPSNPGFTRPNPMQGSVDAANESFANDRFNEPIRKTAMASHERSQTPAIGGRLSLPDSCFAEQAGAHSRFGPAPTSGFDGRFGGGPPHSNQPIAGVRQANTAPFETELTERHPASSPTSSLTAAGRNRTVSLRLPRAAQQPVNTGQLPTDETISQVPLQKLPGEDLVELTIQDNRVSLQVREAPVNTVMTLMAQELGLSLVCASDATEKVSISLSNVPLEDALNAILAIGGCTWNLRDGIIHVSKLSAQPSLNASAQGRLLRVIDLNFIGAMDLKVAVEGLLSPVGQCFISQMDAKDNRRAWEQLIVEDLPANVARIEQFVAQMDRAPRQVMIQAHVLQVNLSDENRHGVNLQSLDGVTNFAHSFAGFVNPLSAPASFITIEGSEMEMLVELIQQTTDAKTLASPKVMVINGQRARIQIGERLGFQVTTTTETSTLQDVQFLDVGVVLEVTPRITQDGQVVMQVKPKISGGQIDNGLPQEDTTEVETTVLLQDGRGIVIGGLIQEFDEDEQAKVPLLGDLWWIGRLFQRRAARKERREIIVALVPWVVPCGECTDDCLQMEYEQATTRLFSGPLDRQYRPWEPSLPDATQDPRRTRYDRLPDMVPNLRDSHPLPYDYYFPRASRNDKYSEPVTEMEVIERPYFESQSGVEPIPQVMFEEQSGDSRLPAPEGGYGSERRVPPSLPGLTEPR